MDLIIVDLEATCWAKDEPDRPPKTEMEIIEIGAVHLPPTLEMGATFQTFVRPGIHPELSPFCRELTTITQAQVDEAPTFDGALLLFLRWIIDTVPGPWDQLALGSWGNFDKNQFVQDSTRWATSLPRFFTQRHINLKTEYAQWQGVSSRIEVTAAVQHLGWSWEGTHHRALDDAQMIARLTQYRLQATHGQPT